MTLRVFSYGGGVQSTAALVLAAQGKIDFKTFLFANVGDDSEHPATLEYVRNVAMPYAEAQGLALVELRQIRRSGEEVTLYQRLTAPGSRSIPIPMRVSNGAPGNRACTVDYKIRRIAQWLKKRGANADNPAIVGLGISIDEFQRAKSDDPRLPYQRKEYPLIALRLNRQDCRNIIEGAGLPVPPKSSCWFCPFHSRASWQEMRHAEPAMFGKAVALEVLLNERRATLGLYPMWLTDKLVPLDQATSPHRQLPMFTDDTEDACESGYCMV